MKLSPIDRLAIMNDLLPKKEDMFKQIIARDIIKKTEFSQKETKELSLNVSPNGSIGYDSRKAKDIDIRFTDSEIEMLKEGVEKADKEKNITQANLAICQKIKSYDISARKKAESK